MDLFEEIENFRKHWVPELKNNFNPQDWFWASAPKQDFICYRKSPPRQAFYLLPLKNNLFLIQWGTFVLDEIILSAEQIAQIERPDPDEIKPLDIAC